MIQKLEADPDVTEQALISWLDISRNTTRSVNTCAILHDPFLISQFWMIAFQYYHQHQNSLLKACKGSKILVIGCWITYHQNQKWLMKLSNRLRVQLKNCTTGETFHRIDIVKICVEKVCNTVWNRWKRWV